MMREPILARGQMSPPRSWRWRRWLLVPAGIAAALLIAWAILYVTKGRFLKGPFERIATGALERRVDVAGDFQLYLDPVTIHFVAEGLTIANPPWASDRPFFRAGRIDSRIATLPLIVGTRRINWLELISGDVDLRWDASGKHNSWTFGDPAKPGRPLDLPTIRRAALTGTRLHYTDPRMRLVADVAFETIRAQRTRLANAIRFQGTGSLRDRPFTLAGSLLSPNETVGGGQNRFALRAASGSDRLTVDGTLPGATEIEGAPLAVTARGGNLARLFDFLGVAVPDTRSYRLAARVTKTGDSWQFRRLRGGFGNSDLAGTMRISMPGDRLRIDADLRSRQVDIVDLGPFIGYQPGAGPVRQVAGRPRILPDAPLRSETLAGFDAHVVYAVTDIRAPSLPVSNVALTLDLERSLLKLSPLTFDVARGHLSSDVVIDARQRPVLTEYDIRLAPTPMGRLLAGWGVEESGTTGTVRARVQLKGKGDSVHESLSGSNGRIAVVLPKGTMWTRNIQLSELDVGTFLTKMFAKKLEKPVEINCGLIAFTVRGGRAMADPILIDTTRNVVTGKGSFDFEDESLDISIRADAKTFSLFSGQSPVGLNGYFAKPALQVITPELLTRAGVGAGLALATPPAAILAFIDPGDAKAAACGPVLAGATAAAQRTTKGKPRKDLR